MGTKSTNGSGRHAGPQIAIVSFGFGHGPVPEADVVLDLREWFRDPHVSPELRGMTGRDYPVIASVLSTPGVAVFTDRIFAAVAELARLGLGTVTVAVGCVGGRHRSAAIADQLCWRARAAGWSAEVVHRDIDKPVLGGQRRLAASAAAARLTRA